MGEETINRYAISDNYIYIYVYGKHFTGEAITWGLKRSHSLVMMIKEILPEKVNFKFNGTKRSELSPLPRSPILQFQRPWCWDGLGAGGEGDDRGWDGWMASLTRWAWVWADSRSWWWTGRSGMLRFMGSQRVGHDWATEPNWTERLWGMTLTFWQNSKKLMWLSQEANRVVNTSEEPGMQETV